MHIQSHVQDGINNRSASSQGMRPTSSSVEHSKLGAPNETDCDKDAFDDSSSLECSLN